jgi:hypothetical protein
MSYNVITAKLVARTAVHVGTGEASGLTDAPIRRDAQGQPLIPGTPNNLVPAPSVTCSATSIPPTRRSLNHGLRACWFSTPVCTVHCPGRSSAMAWALTA